MDKHESVSVNLQGTGYVPNGIPREQMKGDGGTVALSTKDAHFILNNGVREITTVFVSAKIVQNERQDG
jgi:hypothetical protein